MPNHLQFENSLYLLQHADNPVNWYPWGEVALERARVEGKPIFLSIGYAACHWCHVMEHESFEDPDTAALMNEYFINIKVDREERPDLDQIYMSAVVAMTGQGGWPMSVFLTPDRKPFYGGTYFPPVRRYNIPAFWEILNTIAVLWRDDREKLLSSSEKITEHVQKSQSVNFAKQELQPGALDEAVMRLSQSYDWDNGGWGKAPKFPQPMVLRFLLQRASRGNQLALKMAVHTLTAMSKGGMYDVIGGGFARYSTDDLWLIPHFEKMLYDNAQLARCYLYAYKLTGQTEFRKVCEQTLEFIIREMGLRNEQNILEGQGFYSSLDADSEGVEGKYYVWSFNEIEQILEEFPNSSPAGKAPTDLDFLKAAYGVAQNGNFEGNTVLQRKMDDNELSKMFNLDLASVNERLDQIHRTLFIHREKRIRPSTDDKVLTSWNAMALLTFAETARYLDNEKYLEVSRGIANFILTEFYSGERLLRSWRKGIAHHNAYLEDYALLILGLLALYQSDAQVIWFTSAVNLAQEMLDHFTDPEGGFYDTRDDHEDLLVRPRDLQDNATPSGNASAAQCLLYLATYEGNEDLREIAIAMLESIQQTAVTYPTAFSEWLCAIDFALETVKEVAIIGDPTDLHTRELIHQVWAQYRPHLLAAISTYPPDKDAPALLKNRSLVKDKPTAYVCERFLCLRPVNSPAELASMLGDEY